MFDFTRLKRALQAVVDRLDHRMLLPTQSALIRVTQSGAEVQAAYRDKRYVFPLSDVVLLPIPNTTAEMLAWWIAQGSGRRRPVRRDGDRGRGGRVVRSAGVLSRDAWRRGGAPVTPTVVYLGLGSNLGDRQANLAEALQSLRGHVRIERVSPVYETEPAHVTDQPRFLNLAVKGVTTLEPDALLTVIKRIQARMGRRLAERYGPRPIDIDILFFGDRVLATDALEVPHPRVAERGLRPGAAPRHRAGPETSGRRAHGRRAPRRPQRGARDCPGWRAA